MNSTFASDWIQVQEVDAIEEMRLRAWARRHYTQEVGQRNDLHPIIVDEMRHKDQERRIQLRHGA